MTQDTYSIKPIGTLHGSLTSKEHTPKNYDESEHIGTIKIFPEYHDAMKGLEKGQTIVVLFWLHRADRSVLKVHPRGDKNKPKRGVFSTRSPVRPNPIAISELKILQITDMEITVKGVDIYDGTPVVDIKKRVAGD